MTKKLILIFKIKKYLFLKIIKYNEENKGIANDEKSQFKIQLINLLKNNNFMQQRAVKMSITNFLELLNLFNNNGIHFN